MFRHVYLILKNTYILVVSNKMCFLNRKTTCLKFILRPKEVDPGNCI